MTTSSPQQILRIDSSARHEASISRKLTGLLVERLTSDSPGHAVIERDLSPGVPVVTESSVQAYFTPRESRDAGQVEALKASDALVDELISADVLVLGVPMYNFTVPAVLKAYFDLVARAGVTFAYTERGPVGLLENKTAYVAVVTDGVEVGSDADYVTGYVRHFLGFLGITDVHVVAADRLAADADGINRARDHINSLVAA
jgi:FMN-dependent NADH-azoreductase